MSLDDKPRLSRLSSDGSILSSLRKSLSNASDEIRQFSLFNRRSSNLEGDDLNINLAKRKIREYLIKKHSEDPDLFDISDLDILDVEEYHYYERFLEQENYSVEKTKKRIINNLKLRKEMEIGRLTATIFPDLIYRYGYFFIGRPDNDGNHVLHIRHKLYQVFDKRIVDVMRRFMIYHATVTDQIAAKDGLKYSVVADLQGISPKQVDLEQIIWVTEVIESCSANGFKKFYLVNLHWLIKPIVKGILAIIPSSITKLIQVVSRKELERLISKSNLPDYLGGEHIGYRIPPEGCPTFDEFIEMFKDELNEKGILIDPIKYERDKKKYLEIIEALDEGRL